MPIINLRTCILTYLSDSNRRPNMWMHLVRSQGSFQTGESKCGLFTSTFDPIFRPILVKILTQVGQNLDQPIGQKILCQNFNQNIGWSKKFQSLGVISTGHCSKTPKCWLKFWPILGRKYPSVSQNFDQCLGVIFFPAFYKIVHMPCL